MPYHALERPSLGLSLLKAGLQTISVPCDIRYFGFTFAEFIGLEDYLWIQSELPYTAFAGDWTFTQSLYGTRPTADAEYVEQVLRGTWRLDEAQIARVLRIRAYCQHFLDHCISTVPWSDYDIVGFTSTFEQNLASLALARMVKEAFPEKLIAFGGANWEGEMGEALHEHFPFVDIVCSGEADHSFPAVVTCLSERGDLGHIRGIVFRHDGKSVATGPGDMIRVLDVLPIPNFDDFFVQLKASPVATPITPLLLMETSRGCWWGAKQHCTFCGLNGGTMAFRSKSAERVIEEIRHLKSCYDARMISTVDNILDMRYFKTLLPRLAEERLNLSFFYEVKANLSRDQVRQLAEAGIRHVQPGLESLSDRVLALMRKGTTALQNIQLLKWCKEFGIRPEWNFLYGFPGEDPQDYEDMLPLFDAIGFLDPPSGYGPIRLDRFSPYHADPAAYGITNFLPMRPYLSLYPFNTDILMRLAYYFDFEYADGRDPLSYAGPVIRRVQRWMTEGSQGTLWVCRSAAGAIILVDNRDLNSEETACLSAGGLGKQTSAGWTTRLEGWEAVVYELCDKVNGRKRILEVAVAHGAKPQDAARFLEWCVKCRLMLNIGDRYLSLAVYSPPRSDPEVDRVGPGIPEAFRLQETR